MDEMEIDEGDCDGNIFNTISHAMHAISSLYVDY